MGGIYVAQGAMTLPGTAAAANTTGSTNAMTTSGESEPAQGGGGGGGFWSYFSPPAWWEWLSSPPVKPPPATPTPGTVDGLLVRMTDMENQARVETNNDANALTPRRMLNYFNGDFSDGCAFGVRCANARVPALALGVSIEVAGMFFGPEDAAFWALARSKGLWLGRVRSGGKWVFALFTKEKKLLAGAELKAFEVQVKALNIVPSNPGPLHHIATNKNWVSTLRVGPGHPDSRDFRKGGNDLGGRR